MKKHYRLYLMTAILFAAAFLFGSMPKQTGAAERKTYDVSKGNVVFSKRMVSVWGKGSY